MADGDGNLQDAVVVPRYLDWRLPEEVWSCVRVGGMKQLRVLFICRANIGRSQAAMELYRREGGVADSAGTHVDEPGQLLADRPGATGIVSIMQEDYDIDMSHNLRTQLSPAIAAGYDSLVVMVGPKTIPKWLLVDERTELWDVDGPSGKSIAETRRIVGEIEEKVHAISTKQQSLHSLH